MSTNSNTVVSTVLEPEWLDALLSPSLKGFPPGAEPVRRSAIGGRDWNVLRGDLPFPVAVLSESALAHNLRWMQDFVDARNLSFAPHGKTTLSPELFARQREAGTWGITVATLHQLGMAVRAGERQVIVANQVVGPADLSGLRKWLQQVPDLSVWFLVDSEAQLDQIEAWAARQGQSESAEKFNVLLEVGIAGKRTGQRDHASAVSLARRIASSTAVVLRGIECYEGGLATCQHHADRQSTGILMDRVRDLLTACAAEQLLGSGEVLLTAGGTALFDLAANEMDLGKLPELASRVRSVLRSGCYIAHDHGFYKRMLACAGERLNLRETLRPALQVWAMVQSCPEPGLALLTAGRRDLSYDIELPVPVSRAKLGDHTVGTVPEHWRIADLNDHHAYLRFDPQSTDAAPTVGELISLGISHPCTTFDKWPWMPVLDDAHNVIDAITTRF